MGTIVGVAVAVAACGGAYYYLRRNKKTEYVPPEAPEFAKPYFVKVDDNRQVAYSTFGADLATAKGTLLFMHGIPGSRVFAYALDKSAKAVGLHIVALDRPGYARSDPNLKGDLQSWAKDVAIVVKTLSLKNIITLGISGGGAPAAVCAAHLGPDLVKGVILIAAMADIKALGGRFQAYKGGSFGQTVIIPLLMSLPENYVTGLMSMIPPMDKIPLELFPAEDKAAVTKNGVLEIMSADVKEFFVGGFHGPKAAWVHSTRDMYQYIHNGYNFDPKEVKVPVIVMQGQVDRNVPISHANWWVSALEKATPMFKENEGHISIIVNHIDEALEKAVSWL
eukprot:TRINITY_DN2059_c0_g5_i1.p1 TRINITY_DN2059_c0_g5~~TRINITY_DN2059_c0_g5_i1.p1  ORF type:complete len:336 (-),score=80.01 TRINITY_DN2059_c0_g5_i1:962-1969(-)